MLKIEFNKNMHTDFNITQLNSQISRLVDSKNESALELNETINPKLLDLMDIYVKPYDDWNLNTNGF